MVTVELTKHLFTFFPQLEGKEIAILARSARDVIDALENLAPGIAFYLCDERGSLRLHVNIFIAGERIIDRQHLTDPVPDGCLVHVMQALTAGVIETTDGGKTWLGRNKGMLNDYLPEKEAEWGHDPHFVTLCPGDPDHVWQQNHSGVFYSADGAQAWARVSRPEAGVHFGFPIVADETDGKTAWVVPGKSDQERTTIDGKLFVARTEDGGKTWKRLDQGLPRGAYDVVYRHALDRSENSLAFGSTTGNLYVSEDRGESWQTISANLPPIYSVRFG